MAGILDSKLVKNIEETGKLPVIETSFEWEQRNFVECCIGLFIMAVAVIMVQYLLKKFA